MTDTHQPQNSSDTGTLYCRTRVIKRSIALPRAAVASGGPVPALVASRRRYGLALWLFLIATADPVNHQVDLRQFVGFARAFGITGSAATLRRTLSRSLQTLRDLHLIKIVETRHKHFIVELRDLGGTGTPYVLPDAGVTRVVRIPGQLFSNDWHQTLTLKELVALLISLTEESWQFDPDHPGVWEKRRWHISKDYGIAESTWSDGKQGLLYWGLLDWGWSAPVRDYQRVDRLPSNRYRVDTLPLFKKPQEVDTYTFETVPSVTVIAADTGKALRIARRRRVVNVQADEAAPVIPLTTTPGGAA